MSLYEFRTEDAERFASAVGIKTRHKGSELEFLICPYCKGGKNDKNTFSINVKTGQFECKRSSCGMKGNMITLSRDFSYCFELSNDVTRYYNIDDFNNRFKKFRDSHRVIESKDNAIEYLKNRGISEETCRKYELTIKDGTDNLLVFPFKDENGELVFIKYRNITFEKGKTKGAKEWCESNCKPILFGMNHCNLENKTLVITEGQIDSLSLSEAGIENAVSVPTGANGFTWFPHCWDWLQNFEKIVVFGDCENGEITLSNELQKRLPKKVFTVRIEDYRGCKDANEILQKFDREQIIEAVNNAISNPSNLIKRMTEVKMVDIEKTESIKTGFKTVDRFLSGGFHVGQLIVLTGKRGDGKSTLMSQFIVEAIDQGYSCLAYSGELVDFYFKAWIDRQIYGKNNLQQSEVDEINKWYADKLYLFDNNAIDNDSEVKEMDAIIEAIEESIIKYNVKFICIDNLMTAIDLDPRYNTYETQSIFVGKLTSICKKFNVVIILVAHPRKDTIGGDENDSISGTSHITDKADIVMKYQRPKKNTGIAPELLPPRQLAIIKNRLTGKLTGDNPISMYYQEDSKRISESQNGFNQSYIKERTFHQIGIDEEVPF